MADIGELLRAERQALIELLETLSADEWAVPSLCAGWTVQDVAAHVAWMPALSAGQAVRELARSGFRINAMIAATALRWAARGPAAILEQLRTITRTGAVPVGTSPQIGLADPVIHQLDIRRPLRRPRPIPQDAFTAVADLQVRVRWPSTMVVGGSVRRRVRGVRLVAEDTSWSFGDGEDVRGSREALLLLLTNRPVGQGELAGPGVARLSVSR
jgi:uncharacterized protein (TIGR03083 family)